MQQFACLDFEIYIGIFTSIIFCALLSSLAERRPGLFFKYTWSFLSVILSDNSFRAKKLFDRLLSGVWLISCTVLLAAFSGQLREHLLKGKPIKWIDSWQDLYEWDNVKIQSYTTSTLVRFHEKYKDVDPMAKSFSLRTEAIDISKFIDSSYLDNNLDYDGVRNGSVAIVIDLHYLQILKKNLISDDFEEDIDFHISRSGGISQPFFLITTISSFDESLAVKWDMT